VGAIEVSVFCHAYVFLFISFMKAFHTWARAQKRGRRDGGMRVILNGSGFQTLQPHNSMAQAKKRVRERLSSRDRFTSHESEEAHP